MSHDIHGALGRIKADDGDPRRNLRRLPVLLAVLGPGIIVMTGDNDAGGVSTYIQAGQDYGYSLLWVLLLLIPVLLVNQEMVVRLGAVTGTGHARLIRDRFGLFWGWFSVADLFLLNFLTIITEFIGVSLAMSYFGVSPYWSVPAAAVLMISIMTGASFARWERWMLVLVAVSFLVIPMAVLSGLDFASSVRHVLVPGISGGLTSSSVLLIIAIVGTTVAPWQLFFQQSVVVDKGITPEFLSYERWDTTIGSFITELGAGAMIITGTAVAVVSGMPYTSMLSTLHELNGYRLLDVLLAIVLLDASLLGAGAVTVATSYAFGDFFRLRHSLHARMRDAKGFYFSYIAMVIVAAGITLLPHLSPGLITEAVQALAGLLLPSASMFLLLLCNDREVLGPWVNPRWLNALASVIIACLLGLSFILMATTLFPGVDVPLLALWTAALLAAGLGAIGTVLHVIRLRHPVPAVSRAGRADWRMPPVAELKPVAWSPALKLGVISMRAYLLGAMLLLVIKVVELSIG